MLPLAIPGKLKRAGIVGMNRRNVRYIAENNPRELYPRVDDKLKTKQLAIAGGLAVPKLIGVVSTTGQIAELPEFLQPHGGFVIKPSRGSGGKGILVITGRSKERYVKPSGSELSFSGIARHVTNTLSGLFRPRWRPD